MNINLVLSQELLESVDRALGDVARVWWIRRAIERTLSEAEGSSSIEQAGPSPVPSSLRDVSEEGVRPAASAHEPRVVMRRSPRVVARPDVKPFQRGKP